MNIVALHKKDGKVWLTITACVVAVAMLLLGAFSASLVAGILQISFPSAEEAVSSLVAAVRANDIKEMLIILGPGSEALISSGDDVSDRTGREKFLKAYDQLNKLEQESADKMVLHIGTDDWPMPIPIVKKGTTWLFDIDKGKKEILNRRIGRNELHVIEVLDAYVDAQHEYASKDCGGGGKVEFAQKLISTEGKRDGLFWEAKEGEAESPLGPHDCAGVKRRIQQGEQPFSFPRVLFQNPQGPGKACRRRELQLCR